MMLEKVISFSAKNKFITLFLTVVLVFAGYISIKNIAIDAIPDLSDTQVIVYSKWNVSPDIIEDQVTYPIITSLLGVPKVKDIRGVSTFGASYVYVIFEDGTDIYWARSRVLEYMSKIIPQLPEKVKTELGPDATGVGWVYQYALKDTSGKNSLADLRSFQDWFLRYQIQAVPGVSEVATFGGFEKQYQVLVNPNALRTFNIPLSKVSKAIKEGNGETGARVVEYSGIEYMVRLKGYAKNRKDIENIVIGSRSNGVPIYVKNIGRVVEGPDIRRGVGDLNGLGDVVGGIVIMRFGENAYDVIQRVKTKIKSLKSSLPEGVEIVETYDRSDLISRSIDTLSHELFLQMIIVALVILIFLLHFPSAIVPIIGLPSAVIISFILMYFMDVSANIMSLGGIAIAIGAMVDASIVVVENCYKKLEAWSRTSKEKPVTDVIIEAIQEVGPASFYSLLVIAVSFLPIFVLEAQEGRLFKPLAYTKTFAMIVAAILSVTTVPALIILLNQLKNPTGNNLYSRIVNVIFSKNYRREEEHPISKFLFRIYGPIVDFMVRNRRRVLLVAFSFVIVTIPAYLKLGSEFMPPLNEGTILYMPTTMPGLSVTEAQKLLQKQGQMLKEFPEVKTVHGKAGRANTATDPAPLTMMETVIVLKDQDEWRPGMTWNKLISEMNTKMKIPGLTNAWTLPIKGRIDMLTTGIRTPIGIKISGGNLKELESIGVHIETILSDSPNTRSVFAERVTGGFFFDFIFDREALARHGLNIKQAHDAVATAMGGRNLTTTVEGRERYSVNVRYARAFRQDRKDIEKILLYSPKGYQIPLSDVARIEVSNGPGVIRNDNGLLTSYVYVDVDTSDIGGYVDAAKKKIAQELKLPPGYSLTWSGQFESMTRVKEKMVVVLPITLLIVLFLIFLNTKSGVKTTIILLSVPFSAAGAVWLLFLLGYNVSIAVWVGLIALLGVDAEMSIYMLLYLDMAYQKKKKESGIHNFQDIADSIHEGAVKRIRPKMMTVMTTFMALMPIMLASAASTGADLMKRMAAPMVGGIFTSFMLELLVYPAVFAIWKEYEFNKQRKLKSS